MRKSARKLCPRSCAYLPELTYDVESSKRYWRSVVLYVRASVLLYITLPPTRNISLLPTLKLRPRARDVVMPLSPPKWRKRPLAPSVNPGSLMLLMPPKSVIWLSFQKRLTLNEPMYRLSVPTPASALPNHPFFMPFLTVRLMTVSSSPSSTPVIRARSLFRSTT